MNLLTNGRVITRDEGGKGYYEKGAVAYEGTKIVEVGEEAALRAKYPQAEIIDARGGVIMPAFINAHTHIYSALARGLSIVGNNPTNFYEVLDGTWWAMDRKLTLEGSRASADALYIDCIKQGVTTIFDHHASYYDIPGSLDDIAEGATSLGVRASLCYEVSDRDGEKKRMESIEENERFILRAQKDDSDMLKGMMGLHASFTVSDKTLRECNERRHGVGFHVHCAEGPGDVLDALAKYGKRIINRFYDIADGKIRYDGININHIKKADLRHSLGIVLQDVNLFTGTVMDNIRYGKLDATDEECIAAAKLANAHDFITRLPDGYNTDIGEGGNTLSTGEKQLLSFARALLADPRIFVLDEATSSVDTVTEQLIQNAIEKVMTGRTSFIIAHRLSTIRCADVILVVHDGKIIESGTHRSLMSAHGPYYRLYTRQYREEQTKSMMD